jgi:hypothetical protein
VAQLKALQAAGEEIIIFISVNKNVYTRLLVQALRGEGLVLEEQTLCLTGKQAPHSHSTAKVTIVATYAMPGIVCTKSYLSLQSAGVGDHWFQVHSFNAHTALDKDYPKMVHTRRVLCCTVKCTVKCYNKVLKQMLIRH